MALSIFYIIKTQNSVFSVKTEIEMVDNIENYGFFFMSY